MNLYRIQANYKNIYLDETLEAENDKAALESFSASYDAGQLTEREGSGFHDPNFFFLTFEEVDRDETTKVNLGKTSVGIQVGQPGVKSG
jgi:hypothetical protein